MRINIRYFFIIFNNFSKTEILNHQLPSFNKFYQLKKVNKINPFLFLIPTLLVTLLNFSCKENVESANRQQSELLTKIEAVQEQIMAQGDITKTEEQALKSLCQIVARNDGLARYTSENSILLKNVQTPPVFPGCENQKKEDITACFYEKITTYIEKEFNTQIIKDLNLSQPKKLAAFFIIDETGNSTGLKVRNAEITVQAEVLSVLRKLPVMQPAKHHNEKVSVLCSILITYKENIKVKLTYLPERPE